MRLARKLALALGLVVVAIAALEAGLRLSGYEPLVDQIGPRWLYRSHPTLGIVPREGFRGRHRHAEFEVGVAIDERGTRDRPFEGTPRARVLSLGDSMAFGFGVELEDTYAQRLEAALDGVEVLNAGVSSYGTDQQIGRLVELAPTFEPDVVLATFLSANDLDELLGPDLTERGGLVFSEHFAALIDSSSAYRFGLRWSQLAWTLQVRWFEWRNGVQVPRLPREPVLYGPDHVGPPIAQPYLAVEDQAAVEANWTALEVALSALQAQVEALGATLLLVPIPTRQEADPGYWERVVALHGLDGEALDPQLPGRRLAELCERLGIERVDLGSFFEADPEPGRLWYAGNGHLTAAGHARAAEALLPAVRRALGDPAAVDGR